MQLEMAHKVHQLPMKDVVAFLEKVLRVPRNLKTMHGKIHHDIIAWSRHKQCLLDVLHD
jgi:streptomycin 6-kinase